MAIKFADEIVKEIRERGSIEVPKDILQVKRLKNGYIKVKKRISLNYLIVQK